MVARANSSEASSVAMQKREAGKNYIGLLNEAFEETTTAAALPAAAEHGIRGYVLDLIAAFLSRRNKPR